MNQPQNNQEEKEQMNEHQWYIEYEKARQEKEKEERRRNWFTNILILIIIFLVVFLMRCNCNCNCNCGSGCNKNGDATKPSISIQNPTNPSAPDLDDDAGDYVKPTTPEVDGVAIPGWGKLTIPVNTSKNIVVDFFNPDANTDKYYLTFELRIPANNAQGYEVLYKSGLIEPGKHIQKINLSRGLPAGTYNAILHVQPYRMSDKSTTNNADLKLELVVK